jgi:uncharacterized membrane protein
MVMMKEVQSRWKSPILRTALITLVAFCVKKFMKIEIPNEVVDALVDFVLISISGVGIVNDPTNKETM